jgi:hypothetical protein
MIIIYLIRQKIKQKLSIYFMSLRFNLTRRVGSLVSSWTKGFQFHICTEGINFIISLRAAFTDPKCAKRQSSHQRLFALLGHWLFISYNDYFAAWVGRRLPRPNLKWSYTTSGNLVFIGLTPELNNVWPAEPNLTWHSECWKETRKLICICTPSKWNKIWLFLWRKKKVLKISFTLDVKLFFDETKIWKVKLITKEGSAPTLTLISIQCFGCQKNEHWNSMQCQCFSKF